jgi:RNA polymerase sigma factor (sigma-70 family)
VKPLVTASTSAPSREEELVDAAQAGNPFAFEALFRRYRQPISGYVRARVRDEGRTEDLVQEIFLSAHNSLASLGERGAFRAWLYRIAHNACLDEARRRSRTEELILGWDEFPPPDERIVVQNPSPEYQVSQKQEFAELTEAIDELPQSQHDALVMRELEGRSYEEIGQRMRLSPAAVESVLFRARRGVKRAVERAAAFLPFPALFRRGESGEQASGASSFAAAQGTAAQLTAVGGDHAVAFAHKAVAVVAAVAVVGGGTMALEQAGVKVPIVHSITAKRDHGANAAGTAGPGGASFGGAGGAGGANGTGGPGGSGPPGRPNDPMVPGGAGAGSPAALASPVSHAPAAGGGPAAPQTTGPVTAAPGNSAPASPTPGGGGSNGSQGNQPAKVNNGGGSGGGSGGGGSSNSTKGGSGQTDSQPLTTPAGEPIPPELPPGVQHQLESGKRTLDDLPPGLKKKLPDGSTSTP